ncbi:MAG TPA: HAMP domain-containing sensor histidine kinase [Nitrososphaeraceae archaeon]|jgi:signal transduction histidine kinase|nr:HAMP domain-containing sensor histidine kinase [Nitrososphaeraceae archaeon]
MPENTSFKIKSICYRKTKVVAIISVVLIISISYGLFFYFQDITERNIKNNLFAQQRDRQVMATKVLSQNIASDLGLVEARLEGLSNSIYLQQGDLSSNNMKTLVHANFLDLDDIVDHLFVVNNNNTMTVDIAAKHSKSSMSTDVLQRQHILQAENTLKPVYSNGFVRLDGKTRIGITYPIINTHTGKYLGLVGATVPIVQFLSNYENTYNIQSRFLVALDKSESYMVTPRTQLLGKNYFAKDVQEFFHNNQIQNSLYNQVFSGKPGYAVYDFGSGERLNTGYPVLLSGKPTYFVFVITPTTTIYSQVDKVLFSQRIETFSLLAGASVAIVVLIVFLIKWIRLSEEVKRRGKELEEANIELETTNKQLSVSNEQLKIREKAQQEFINIAAHELRTPIQPIIGLSEVLRSKNTEGQPQHPQHGPILDVIIRNAKRLQKLSQVILDITRIESGLLTLNKERFDLQRVIINTIDDYRNHIRSSNLNVEIVCGINKDEETTRDGGGVAGRQQQQEQLLHKQIINQNNTPAILIEADKVRIMQVIDNLLSNALKFTKEGTISLSVESNDKRQVVISVKDNGQGIDPNILPRLFTKFATKSEFGGTGLGLFISKNIIEAHGGKIWAENNPNEKGATFYFSLPLVKPSND